MSTDRFHEKKQLILDTATSLINTRGVDGMTFVDVAKAINLNTTSVTYYFRRKELLASAVFDNSLDRMSALVHAAGEKASPRERVHALLHNYLELFKSIRAKDASPIAVLSDMRTIEGDTREHLKERYVDFFRLIRSFYGTPRNNTEKFLFSARTHVLLESIYWMMVWLRRYSTDDFPRVEHRMNELFEHGVAKPGAEWKPVLLDDASQLPGETDTAMPVHFIRAATELINQRGYRGASVERIAAELNVTKGSFYHHLEGKDDLVMECFARSYGRVSDVQLQASLGEGDHWQKFSSTIATLLNAQFFTDFPLLRTTALAAIPIELRRDVVDRSNKMARRFAGMIIDGITEGSCRAVDPLIASQIVMSSLNAAYDLKSLAAKYDPAVAVELYASCVGYGIVETPPGFQQIVDADMLNVGHAQAL